MNQRPPAPAPTFMDDQEFAALLETAGDGHILVLATETLTALGTAAVAIQELLQVLDERHRPYRVLIGSSPVTGIDPISAEHERRWLAAGDLHERFLSLTQGGGKAPWLVVYADPWAANLDERIREFAPQALRLIVDDFIERVAQEGDAWPSVIDWLAAKERLSFLPTKVLMAWSRKNPGSGLAPVEATLGFQQRWEVVIDEHAGEPPAPGVLEVLISRHPDGVVMISPHLPWYLEHHQGLVEGCLAAWRPAELSIPVYRALLSRTHRYVAATGVPYHAAFLRDLPAQAEAWIPQGTVVDPVLDGTHRIQWFRDREELRQRLSGQTPPSTMPLASAGSEHAAGTLAGWWRSLGNLTGEQQEVEKPESASADPGQADFAFLACCYKYLQRFRVFIDSIARQDYPLERIEVALALPGNPDGIIEYIDMIRMVHPGLQIRVVELPEEARRNKGQMLNAAFARTSARVVMSTDVDIVFPKDFVRTMLTRHRADQVLGCWRTPLSKDLTAQILVGNLDPVEHFHALQQQWDKQEETGGVRQGMLGYCQVVDRLAFAAVGYPEEFEGYNQSDIVFIDRLRERAGIESLFMKDYFVLHLSHSRDWTGTKVFL